MYCYITLGSTGILIRSCVTFTLDREASVLLDFYTVIVTSSPYKSLKLVSMYHLYMKSKSESYLPSMIIFDFFFK